MGHADVVARALRSLAVARGGVSVTLRRGGYETTGVSATANVVPVDVQQRDGTYKRVEYRDYLILAADYQLDGIAREPKAGDLIEELQGSTRLSSKVVPFAGGTCFEPVESTRTGLRIHTEIVGEGVPEAVLSEDGNPLYSEDGRPLIQETE